MQRTPRSRPFVGSLVAGLAMIAPLATVSVCVMYAQPVVRADGNIDDAGPRSAGLFFVVLPLLYIAAAVLCLAAGQALLRFGLHRLWHHLGLAALVSFAIAIPVGFATSQPGRFGWTDTLAAFGAIGGVLLISGGLGATCWWWFAVRPRTNI